MSNFSSTWKEGRLDGEEYFSFFLQVDRNPLFLLSDKLVCTFFFIENRFGYFLVPFLASVDLIEFNTVSSFLYFTDQKDGWENHVIQ